VSERSGDLESLYPFLYDGTADTGEALAQAVRSTAEKIGEVSALRDEVARRDGERLAACAAAMAGAFRSGGRLFTFGNGGSSTDAAAAARLFAEAPGGRAVPAVALTNVAVVTALANDVGFDVVFARQLAAWGRAGDVALAFSTSGDSENLLCGLAEARRLGLLTVAVAGYAGGRIAEEEAADHLFVVPSASVHRIQEVQTTLWHVLWQLVQQALASA
jgi:D-sedoheptulose 7-phosphate isomerase